MGILETFFLYHKYYFVEKMATKLTKLPPPPKDNDPLLQTSRSTRSNSKDNVVNRVPRPHVTVTNKTKGNDTEISESIVRRVDRSYIKEKEILQNGVQSDDTIKDDNQDGVKRLHRSYIKEKDILQNGVQSNDTHEDENNLEKNSLYA